MQMAQRKQRFKRRPFLLFLLLISTLIALLLWMLFAPRHAATLPMTYTATQGSVGIPIQINGQMRSIEFNSLLTRSVLNPSLHAQLAQGKSGVESVVPSAEVALGSYHTKVSWSEVAETELHPSAEGILGLEPFVPSAGLDGKDHRLGGRLTLDFKANRFYIEDGAHLPLMVLPKGTLQAPLQRDEDGTYYLVLSLNDGPSYRFLLGIGCRDVLLPTGAVLFPNREGNAYVNAVGVVPVTLTVDGKDLTVQAAALPGIQTTGILGMSLLANFRVVVDFRNDRLYLEPADSRSSL